MQSTPTNEASKVKHYVPFENELDMRGIQIPVKPSEMMKFECQNISVTVLVFEDGHFYPLYLTKLKEDAKHKVDVLFFQKGSKSH